MGMLPEKLWVAPGACWLLSSVARAGSETGMPEQAYGTVWLLVVCLGVMVLAGFNSRKPRSRRHAADRQRRQGDGNDLTQPDDSR